MLAVIRCPETGKSFEVELPTSATVLEKQWRRTVATQCPHCGDTHLEGFKQLFMRSVIDSDVDRSSLAHGAFRRYR